MLKQLITLLLFLFLVAQPLFSREGDAYSCNLISHVVVNRGAVDIKDNVLSQELRITRFVWLKDSVKIFTADGRDKVKEIEQEILENFRLKSSFDGDTISYSEGFLSVVNAGYTAFDIIYHYSCKKL